VLASENEVSAFALLKGNRNYRRLFFAQVVSSLGDWVGVFAIAAFAYKLNGDAGVGTVMTARVLPGFLVGPLAGVAADRWDRKKMMVVADLSRAAIVFTLPFVPSLLFLLVASMLLESLTLLWGPAKDASLPQFVPTRHLPTANSMNLIAVYGPWPLASIVFAFLATIGAFFARHVSVLSGLQESQQALALWMDSFTFAFSAFMISRLTIQTSKRRAGKLDFREVKRDLVEGLTFIKDHKQVRPWLIGIGTTFAAAGGVFSLGIGFVDKVLGGGERGFAFLVGFLATGMIIGLLAVGALARRIQKDVLFSSSLILLAAGLIGLASMNNLTAAIPIASALGFFGGVAYSLGYSLMQEATSDELRGRTFGAAYTVIRIGTLAGLGVFPFLASAIGDHELHLAFGTIALPGSRITLWAAGLVVLLGGFTSMRAIRARHSLAQAAESDRGYFVAFEGGEGAGKSTQMEALVRWLRARGDDVVVTKEPGGTVLGRKIRDLVLDPEVEMDPRAEALLYAADRAQHVAEVIGPALKEGKIVVTDRFVDSSLAYQGLGRGLGLDEIYRISEWATGGLMPDLVFYLKVDPQTGLGRVHRDLDRIEREDEDFHERVSRAYVELSNRYSSRFVVVDASRPTSEVHRQVVESFVKRVSDRVEAAGPQDVPAPGTPAGR
jgi:dTMP kinase